MLLRCLRALAYARERDDWAKRRGDRRGAGTRALSGSLTDYGINDDFVRKLDETIPVDSSALFVLVKSVTEDKVLAEIEHYKPRVLKTSLSTEDEAKLKDALSKAA